MLLLADNPLSEQIAKRLAGAGAPGLVAVADPYDALEAMGRREFPVVVLSPTAATPSGAGEFAALCRATRRLQKNAKLYALCPPRLEMEVCELVGEALDDYFITPPSPADLRTLAEPACPVGRSESPVVSAVEPPAAIAAEPRRAGVSKVEPLSCEEFAQLASATFSRMDLEAAVAAMVAAKVKGPLEWMDESLLGENYMPLLRLPAGPAGPKADTHRLLAATEPATLDAPAKALLAALERILPALYQAAKRTEVLHHLAITDELTGAYNRRYFYHATDKVLREAAAKNLRATLLLYDIDDFKTYNDRYSYAVGDEILRETADLMRRITREHDIVARIGGDEFAVLFWDRQPPRLPDSKPPDSALVLARRFLKALHRHAFHSLGPKATGVLTISGGLASFPADGTTCRELLRKADQALKAVKRTGKKGIRIVGPLTEDAEDSRPG
jgi:diguanylate cyclase (GGDEF)-like protein